MNTLLLDPTDVLFFRDGRPMGGASSGHGAAWPLPSVVNHALHAALHRAGDAFASAHTHRRGRSGDYTENRDRRFGSLKSAGPFPVCAQGKALTWFFPRPADADDSGQVVLMPMKSDAASSLKKAGKYPVLSTIAPSKEPVKPWWSEGAWNEYLGTNQRNDLAGRTFRKNDNEFSDTEHSYGIEIDPGSGSVVDGQFYSAHYLRLRGGWKLGLFAEALDKEYSHPEYGNDLVRGLLNGHGTQIIAGGQQRICTATLDASDYERLPLPLGKSSDFRQSDGKHLVKWILLTPAIYPEITAGVSRRGTERKAHPGGWLPTWVCPDTGKVLLETVSKDERKRRRSLNAGGQGYASSPNIDAHLVAAIVGKPVPVTGWALPNGADREEGGAKSTHLAVPAGSVYYFECDSPEDAQELAAALNWHGSETNPTAIRNRRSTLMGEKGFGLGVCGAWDYHPATPFE